MLTYSEHYKKAVKEYGGNVSLIDKFYQIGVFDAISLSKKYYELINCLSKQVSDKIDKVESKTPALLTDFDDVFSLNGIIELADEIVPQLEENLYGCHLFVDKIYCYRNHHYKKRYSSWLWHWDNNPQEVFKIIIYLTSVDDECGPFEYISGPDKSVLMKKSTRTGYDNWKKAPNGSRINKEEVQSILDRGGSRHRVIGPPGTLTAFNNNIWHRANVPAPGKSRDIITLRVRPTIKPVFSYIDKAWTTTSKLTGAVPKNPERKRPDDKN